MTSVVGYLHSHGVSGRMGSPQRHGARATGLDTAPTRSLYCYSYMLLALNRPKCILRSVNLICPDIARKRPAGGSEGCYPLADLNQTSPFQLPRTAAATSLPRYGKRSPQCEELGRYLDYRSCAPRISQTLLLSSGCSHSASGTHFILGLNLKTWSSFSCSNQNSPHCLALLIPDILPIHCSPPSTSLVRIVSPTLIAITSTKWRPNP